MANLSTAEEAQQGGENRDSCGRSIFGHGAGWEVDMHVRFFQEIIAEAKGFCAHFQVRDGGERGLFHDIAELACQFEFALPFGFAGFDKEDVSACGGPCESCGEDRKSTRLNSSHVA